MSKADDRLIVALDFPNALQGLHLVEKLGDEVSFYKIGLGMLTGGGMALANELTDMGKKVFLDMKLFDIGQTVENAVSGLSQFDLNFLTVHGDPNVVRAAVAGRGTSNIKILAVTVLTSMDRSDLDLTLIRAGDIQDIVVERARLAFLAGADGVISSPHEAAMIRALPEATDKLIVTPGVRLADTNDTDDQKRVASPAFAIKNGANHIVVGRPIWRAEDPLAAARKLKAELAAI